MSHWRERLLHQRTRREQAGLWRVLPKQDSPELVDFCSNDYLALAKHPAVVEGAQKAVAKYGGGARASRLITGNYPLAEELEEQLAQWKGTEAALVFPSGYQANIGLLSTLLEVTDAVFVDRLAHACLIDGVRLSPAKMRVFPHNDLKRLEELLQKADGASARWILADAVYSMDGDLAPLPQLLELARRYDATVILDDAHGTGTTGELGRGTTEHFSINPKDHADHLIIVVTMSKALGSQGGAICGTADLRNALVNTSRPFVYSTGLSPAAAGAALGALRVLADEPARVEELQETARLVREHLTAAGFDLFGTQTAIVPLCMVEAASALEASRQLRERGLLVLPIRPPTVPRHTSRLRLTVTLNQTREATLAASETIASICQSLLS